MKVSYLHMLRKKYESYSIGPHVGVPYGPKKEGVVEVGYEAKSEVQP